MDCQLKEANKNRCCSVKVNFRRINQAIDVTQVLMLQARCSISPHREVLICRLIPVQNTHR
jgi:hypothetical protein